MPPIAMPVIAPLPIPGLELRFRAGLGRDVRVVRGGLIEVVGVVTASLELTVKWIMFQSPLSRYRMSLSTVRAGAPPVIVTGGSRLSLEVNRSWSDGVDSTVRIVNGDSFQNRVD